jgi:hypothetical protein
MMRQLRVLKDIEKIMHVKYFGSFMVTFISNALTSPGCVFEACKEQFMLSSFHVYDGTVFILAGCVSNSMEKYCHLTFMF